MYAFCCVYLLVEEKHLKYIHVLVKVYVYKMLLSTTYQGY